MKTLKQHLYDNCRGQTLYIDEMINLTKEWLQEQLQSATAKEWEVDEIDLYVIKTNLIEELEQ